QHEETYAHFPYTPLFRSGRWNAGGARSGGLAADVRAGECPHPGLPPRAGEGAATARSPPSTVTPPSPARGGGLGWGQAPADARRKSSRPARPPSRPSPTSGGRAGACPAAPCLCPSHSLPRRRGKGQGLPGHLHRRHTPSPARGGGPGWGRTMPPATKKGPAIRGAPAAREARRNSAAVAVRVARQRALDTVPRGTGRVARAVPLQARAPAAALVLGAQVRLGLLEVAVGEPRAAFVTGAVGRRIVLVAVLRIVVGLG